MSELSPLNNVHVITDLLSVGKKKPLGYLPLQTIKDEIFGGYNEILTDVCAEVIKRGNEFIFVTEKESNIASGAMYVFHSLYLLEMLENYHSVLSKAGVPTDDCIKYIKFISSNIVRQEEYPEAYRVIGLTFNDKRFR